MDFVGEDNETESMVLSSALDLIQKLRPLAEAADRSDDLSKLRELQSEIERFRRQATE